jgi:hypothetical protein
MNKMQSSITKDLFISGNNDYKKFIELPVKGEFNTIQTIVIPEDEWIEFNKQEG